jgi:hypothetical protein
MKKAVTDEGRKKLWLARNYWRLVSLPLVGVLAVILVRLGIDLWQRWKIAAIVVGLLMELLSGCHGVRLFKAS